MSYKYWISKHIYRDERAKELGCYAQISIETPFAPYVDLTIRINAFDEIITQVIWDNDEKVFYCRVKNEGPVLGNSYESTKEMHLDSGWELKKDFEPGKIEGEY